MQLQLVFRRGLMFITMIMIISNIIHFTCSFFFASTIKEFFSYFRRFKQLRYDFSIEMRYAAAYVLATLGGNTNPDVATISKILGSVGIDCDNTKAQKVIDACKGKNVDQIIEEGTKKLSSLPAGGAAAPAAVGAAPAATTGADAKKGAAKEEPKKEEKKKEESDEEGEDMVCRELKKIFFEEIAVFSSSRDLVYSIKSSEQQTNYTSASFVLVTMGFFFVCVFCIDML
jgi:large subunit ribosomal protein LP2